MEKKYGVLDWFKDARAYMDLLILEAAEKARLTPEREKKLMRAGEQLGDILATTRLSPTIMLLPIMVFGLLVIFPLVLGTVSTVDSAASNTTILPALLEPFNVISGFFILLLIVGVGLLILTVALRTFGRGEL